MDKQDISQERFEEIERYLLGHMDNEERLRFENRIAADPELAAEVRLQQSLVGAVETGAFFSDSREIKSIRTFKSYAPWYWAAAAVLLFAIAAFWFVKRSAGSAENLYAEFYQPDPGLPVEMGAADSTVYHFYDGMISYKEGNYAQALVKWKKLGQTPMLKDTLQYYLGMAQLNKGATDEGINTLKAIASKPGAPYYQQANWYIALVYLKRGDKKSAQVLLKKIPAYPGALSLLNKL